MKNLELQKRANDVRKGIVTAVHGAKAGHPGGSLSAADIFTFLYFEEMNIDPQNPDMEERDRFVLSKGHTAPGLYSALAYRGYFPVEDLPTLRHLGSYLQGHPCIHIPGVDMSSGSLGQGISAAVGMALGAKMENRDFRVYTLLGDGEIEEGQVWEAAMFAGFRKLDNLCVMEITIICRSMDLSTRYALLILSIRSSRHSISMSSMQMLMILMRSVQHSRKQERPRACPPVSYSIA